MNRKWIGTTVAASMMVTLIAACSNNTPAKPAAGGAVKEQSKDASKIVIYMNTNAISRKPEGSDPKALEEVTKYVKEQTGVEAKAIIPPKGSEKDKLNVLLASGDQLDVFQGGWDEYKQAIIPLNDLLDKYGPDIKKAWDADAWKLMTDKDGKIWGIPRIITTAPFPLWVRADWLQKLNLPMPKTLDEFENVLKAFKERDPDGNGKDDSIPILLDDRFQYGLVGAFTENGYSNWIDPKDNKLKIPELQPGYVDFLAKMADWYQKGYIYRETFAKYDVLEMLKTNRVGAVDIWYSNLTVNAPKVAQTVKEMDYQAIPDIKGPKGYFQTAYPGTSSAMLVTKSSKSPEGVIKFINWQYQNVENHLTAWYGLKDKHWKWADEGKKTVEVFNPSPYAGEFMITLGLAMERKYATNDPLRVKHSNFLNNELTKFDIVKMPLDLGVIYDQMALKEKVPNAGDLDRLRKEEVIKFIMGARPISDYNKFVDELYKAGLDKLIDFQTEQYNKQKK
ncbi:extracellular solute-binding protein [Paenibacillus periandrae]|uniref:extracellular solute-binding protein n=1 Tax=Paenibacillus periandrae TaxID=1761741 RepID=UPI001F09EE2E|nr:extracellular solute-binding protein [Paenibacillus periandrae]